MKRLISLTLFVSLCSNAQERKLWKWSAASLAMATVADCHSSYGKRELNPVLRGSGNRFDVTSVALKAGAVGVLLLGQKLFLPGRTGKRRSWAALNFSMAATTSLFAARNYSIRR